MLEVFSGKPKSASAKVEHGNTLKVQTKLAIGAFRVAFVTEDSAASTTSHMLGGVGTGRSLRSRESWKESTMQQRKKSQTRFMQIF